jgi:serine/threonine protein kinase
MIPPLAQRTKSTTHFRTDFVTPSIRSMAVQATSLGELRVEFVPQSGIDGTLAYLAPEQTGRTGRPVDHRADLYALGATLYELATGGPPFGVGDPLRLVHDHLARVPTPPAALNPSLPAAFSQIVLRLLEKEPDNRYQTADGVVYALERVRDAAAGSAPAPVRLGERDLPLRLLWNGSIWT